MKKKVLIAVALLATIVIAYGIYCDYKVNLGNDRQQVKVAVGRNLWNALTLVAERKGYFEAEGLDVELIYQDAGKYCMDALIASQVEFANVVEVNVAYLGYTGNEDVRVLGSVVESTSCGIVAPDSTGIRSARDLKGRTLAYSPGTGGELFARRFLDYHGLQGSDVSFRKLQPKAIGPAIISGDVDAASTWDPFIYGIVKSLEGKAVVFREPDAYVGYMFIATRASWSQEHPEAVTAFLRALQRAELYIQQNQTEAQVLLAEELRVDTEVVRAIWPYFEFDLSFEPEEIVRATHDVGVIVGETDEGFRGKDVPEYVRYFDFSYAPAN